MPDYKLIISRNIRYAVFQDDIGDIVRMKCTGGKVLVDLRSGHVVLFLCSCLVF